AVGFAENALEQRGLAGTQEAGEDGGGDEGHGVQSCSAEQSTPAYGAVTGNLQPSTSVKCRDGEVISTHSHSRPGDVRAPFRSPRPPPRSRAAAAPRRAAQPVPAARRADDARARFARPADRVAR